MDGLPAISCSATSRTRCEVVLPASSAVGMRGTASVRSSRRTMWMPRSRGCSPTSPKLGCRSRRLSWQVPTSSPRETSSRLHSTGRSWPATRIVPHGSRTCRGTPTRCAAVPPCACMCSSISTMPSPWAGLCRTTRESFGRPRVGSAVSRRWHDGTIPCSEGSRPNSSSRCSRRRA